MAAVLRFRGIDTSPEKVAEAIYSKTAAGTLDIDMILYAGKSGRKSIQYRGSLNDIRANIDARNPLIVLVDSGYLIYQRNHFMVVVGYDEQHVIVNSGWERLKTISNAEFVKTWGRAGYWTLLIL